MLVRGRRVGTPREPARPGPRLRRLPRDDPGGRQARRRDRAGGARCNACTGPQPRGARSADRPRPSPVTLTRTAALRAHPVRSRRGLAPRRTATGPAGSGLRTGELGGNWVTFARDTLGPAAAWLYRAWSRTEFSASTGTRARESVPAAPRFRPLRRAHAGERTRRSRTAGHRHPVTVTGAVGPRPKRPAGDSPRRSPRLARATPPPRRRRRGRGRAACPAAACAGR